MTFHLNSTKFNSLKDHLNCSDVLLNFFTCIFSYFRKLYLRWLQLEHICIHVSSLNKNDALESIRKLFNRKSILRNSTHPKSWNLQAMLTGEKFKKANARAEKARKLKSTLQWINQKTRCGKWKCGKYLVPNELFSLKLVKQQSNSLNAFFYALLDNWRKTVFQFQWKKLFNNCVLSSFVFAAACA